MYVPVFRKFIGFFVVADDFKLAGIAELVEGLDQSVFSEFLGDFIAAGTVAILLKAGKNPGRNLAAGRRHSSPPLSNRVFIQAA